MSGHAHACVSTCAYIHDYRTPSNAPATFLACSYMDTVITQRLRNKIRKLQCTIFLKFQNKSHRPALATRLELIWDPSKDTLRLHFLNSFHTTAPEIPSTVNIRLVHLDGECLRMQKSFAQSQKFSRCWSQS